VVQAVLGKALGRCAARDDRLAVELLEVAARHLVCGSRVRRPVSEDVCRRDAVALLPQAILVLEVGVARQAPHGALDGAELRLAQQRVLRGLGLWLQVAVLITSIRTFIGLYILFCVFSCTLEGYHISTNCISDIGETIISQ